MSTEEDKSLDFRRDNRSVKKFKEDIKFRTAKEKFLIELYKTEMEAKGHKIRIENNGIDNTGNFVAKSSCVADYKIQIDGEKPFLVDIKNSPVIGKMTYKVVNLQN